MSTFRIFNKARIGLVLLTILAGLAPIFFSTSTSVAQEARDCDANAVVRCGAYTVSELRSKLSTNIQTIFAHYGINDSDLDSMVDGAVRRDGNVVVNGQVVATNAISVGRQNIPGSTFVPSISVYERPVSVSFRSDELSAFVKMTNGRFEFAILKSCGNPVKATPPPVTPPPPPPPTPSPPSATPPPQPTPTPPAPPARVVKVVKVVEQQKAPPLPDTGPGALPGIFMATTFGGFLGHNLVNRFAKRLLLRR